MKFRAKLVLLVLALAAQVVCCTVSLVREDLKEVATPRGSPIDEGSMQTILHGVQQELPESLYLLAMMKFYGHGVDQNVEAAVTLLSRAAERGHRDAEFALGVLYGRGEGVVHSDTLSASWLAKSAARGHIDAKWMLAALVFTTRKIYRTSQTSVLITFCRMYNEGRGVDEDVHRAVKLLQDAGNPQAKFHLGVMYEYGRGVAQNFKTAAELYRQASEHQVPDAFYNLGLLHLQGRGVEQNFEHAREYFQQAVDLGSAQAMYALGQMHVHGQGSSIDYSQALYWLKRAAVQDDVRVSSTAHTVANEIELVLSQAELQVQHSERLLGVPIRVQIGTIDGN
ncbi:Sel1 repeat [Phytophthora infestans]|uniref:Sel1 repeat n=1 Tax=Phytophthora infestans TaxID=4787 RepID=A0A8S9V9R0_PHYIN|nr:Sel1 repeat [Phytophthora infestans]